MDNVVLKSLYKSDDSSDPLLSLDNFEVHTRSRYEFIQEVDSEGSQYTVFKAEDIVANRPVCIKIPFGYEASDFFNQARFIATSSYLPDEAIMMARLRHPNVVRVLDWCLVDGYPGIVLEWLDGCTLEKFAFTDLDHMFCCLGQVADGLDYIHSNEVYNGDVHPKNILMVDGIPVIADFGSSNISAIAKVKDYVGPRFGYNLSFEIVKKVDLSKFVMLSASVLTGIDLMGKGYVDLKHMVNRISPLLSVSQINGLNSFLYEKLYRRKGINNAKEVVNELRELLLVKSYEK